MRTSSQSVRRAMDIQNENILMAVSPESLAWRSAVESRRRSRIVKIVKVVVESGVPFPREALWGDSGRCGRGCCGSWGTGRFAVMVPTPERR